MSKIKYYGYSLTLKKSEIPLVFIDTFFWRNLLKLHDLRKLLEECCKANKVLVVTTNFLEGELRKYRILEEVKRICGNSLVCVPIGRISANQIIHAMIAYKERLMESELSWETSISESPILEPIQKGLKELVDYFRDELNKLRSNIKGRKKRDLIISMLIDVELEFWKNTLKIYGDLLNLSNEEYEQFFHMNYFRDLPSIVIRTYLFGDILRTNDVKTEDVVDVFNISEIVPYTAFSIIDGKQYERLSELKFKNDLSFESQFNVEITHGKAPNPEENLKSFLEWCLQG